MIELYLLRHGEAEPQGSYEDDTKRNLTSRGEEQVLRVGRHLQAMDLSFDRVISSPYERAMQTAKTVLSVLSDHQQEVAVSKTLIPNAPCKDILKELKPHANCKRILLVGHMPHLGQLTSFLISGTPNVQMTFETAGMARIDFQNTLGMGKLVWLMSPEQMD